MIKTVLSLLLLLCVAPVASVAAQDGTAVPVFPGMIAYIGTDYNVYTLAGTDGTRAQLTTDAGRSADRLMAYQWPTWSTDGRLAYFALALDRATQTPTTHVFVSADADTTGISVYEGSGQVYNYAFWAPQNCSPDTACRDLAVLLSDVTMEGLLVERVRVNGEPSSEALGTGAPFYYSWSPDGTRMLWQRNNRTFDIFDLADGEITSTLDVQPGSITAPAWSPIDDRLLLGVRADDGATDLTIIGREIDQPLAAGLSGIVSYAWSPDGNRVAYTAEQGALMVLDAVTGHVLARSPVSGVLAFFWSPDSRQVAYVTLAVQPGSFSASRSGMLAAQAQGVPGLAWSVLEVDTAANRRLAAFLPTQDMLYLLTFFDQFSQSHRVWSPDSRHVVYGEITDERRPVVTVLNVGSQEPIPLTVAEGQIGIWSFE